MKLWISGLLAISAFAAAIAPGASRAANLATLYSFCSLANCADSAYPSGLLIFDANGSLFGTTEGDGGDLDCSLMGPGCGTVFEIAKTPGTTTGYANSPIILYSFCAQANCTDGKAPLGGVIADASGNLFGTTLAGGSFSIICGGYVGCGTAFEIAKTPGTPTGYANVPIPWSASTAPMARCPSPA